MKIKLFKTFFFLTLSLSSTLAICQIPSNDPSWTINSTVSDDFTTGSLDAGKWVIGGDWRDDAFNRCDNGVIYYLDMQSVRTTTDISFTNSSGQSFATITTKKVNYPAVTLPAYASNPCSSSTSTTGTRPYTSLEFLYSKKWFKYGFFEIRCRLPILPSGKTNNGLGANFWLYYDGQDKDGAQPPYYFTCPKYSEIDIFEILAVNNSNTTPAAHEWGTNSHYYAATSSCPLPFTNNIQGTNYAGTPSGLTYPPDGGWHTFAVNWSPGRIDYYFDNNQVSSSFNYPSLMEPLRMIIDVNVFKSVPADATTVDPYNYDIDYVKVYELNTTQKNNCYINTSGPNFNSIVNSVYQCINLGNGTISTSSQKEQNLRATDYINFGPGFEIGAGTSFYAECMSDPTQLTY